MTERGFTHEEHTADLRVRAWGATLGDAFAEAARGLVAYMVEPNAAPFEREIRIEGKSETLPRLLVAFLEDVLFTVLTDLLILGRFEVDVHREGDHWRLSCTARGAPYVEALHGHVHEVKAVTFHDLELREEPPEVAVVLDI